MSSIESLGISGIRGYSPQNYQKIQFLRPLTLIWGKNGSGKTTIIECLKYITTGSLPPNSDKGKSFIMDTKVAGKPQVIGDIRLIFKTGNREILAKRRMQLSAKGNTTKFQSIEQVLKTKGQKGEDLTINHQCAEIEKQVPQFLGISKPILENIVFCHQDESLWPFGDSTLLKNIFDELFQTKKITKQMQRMWDIHKQQQSQLKELKIRLQYQKQTHKKQLQQRSKLFLQLEQIKLKGKQMQATKQKILSMKDKLKDTCDKSKQRDKLILRKGRLFSSIKSLQMKIRTWKQNFMRVEKNHEQKMQGKLNNFIEEDESITVSRNYNIGFGDKKNFSQHQINNTNMLDIQSAQKGMQLLQEKRALYTQLNAKYKSVKEQYETMRAFKQTTKREQEIKSQQERVKNFFSELKYVKDVRTDEDFVRIFRQKLTEMEQKINGVEISRNKLRNLEKNMPPLVQLGFNEKEVQDIRKQSKQLQADMSSSSVKILRIYKAQYKPLSAGVSSALKPSDLSRGQLLEHQLQSINAILKSKQLQLKNYEQLAKSSTHVDKNSIQNTIHHYRIAGIQLQNQMLHFCEEKKKCYFCSKKMTQKQIQAAQEKVQLVKTKAQEKLRELQTKRGDQAVDPQLMVKKLKDEIAKLLVRQQGLNIQVTKFDEQKKTSIQIEMNNALAKQLQKCNLSLQMLPKLSHVIETDPKPQEHYKTVSLQQFVQMSSAYQVKLARYRGVKQQANKIEINKRQNEINRQKREQCMKEKTEIENAIKQAQSETKGYDFLKNSYQKLESLVRMQTKSKNKKQKDYSSSQNSNFSIEEAQQSMKELYMNILEEKVYIEKLQISIGCFNDSAIIREEKEQLGEVERELARIGNYLKQSEQLQAGYNQLFLSFTRESQRYRHRLSIITSSINTALIPTYLTTLNKTRHLQASICNIEQCYHLMQESVSQYHAQKMQQINRYIYEVWREIYHGEDIEYIMIEAVMDAGSKKKKKNYDYRIMMKKSTKNFGNKQEMVEMKGRCSTGQKVLASIVIRLALAEVFCSSTRILALDEPTTNLDKQHIHNLAEALLRLIELSGGKNFQLIIISHDIDFIQLLEQYADSYYEVKRDENRFSTIEKRMIKDIFHGQ